MSLEKILKIIKANKTFLISTHVSPDPDALCSEIALALYLKSLGKKVHVVNTESVPERFHFLPKVKMVKALREVNNPDYDVAIVVDCGDLDRIDHVKAILREDKILINIDHHVTNDLFGDLNLVHKASSTAEILFDLFEKGGCRFNRDIAILLYLGIMTDTGSFRYDSTTAHTHEVISRLMRFNVPISELYGRLYEQVPFSDLKMFTKVIGNLELLFEGQVVVVELRQNVLNRFSVDFDLREKIFSFLRTIRGVKVVVIFSENHSKMTRVNFRSQGKVDVAQLAYYFQGGGHKKASGCLIRDNMKKAKEKVLSRLENVL